MARIRSIKPEFPQSETIGRLSRDARLLFVMLWTIVDDEGRARAASRMLASLLFPYDDDAPALIEGWLSELEGAGCIRRYEVEGASYLDLPNWLKHQKIDKASKSKLPAFDEHSRKVASPREASAPDLDLGPRITERAKADALGAASAPPAPIRSERTEEARPNPAAPSFASPVDQLWTEGVEDLIALGANEKQARSMCGRWLRDLRGDAATLLSAIALAKERGTGDPIPFINRVLNPSKAQQNDRNARSVIAACDRLDERIRASEELLGDHPTLLAIDVHH